MFLLEGAFSNGAWLMSMAAAPSRDVYDAAARKPP